MGSEGSTRAELDLEKTGVREKTAEVPTSLEPAGSEEKGSTTLGCASAGVGVGVGAASCTTTLMVLQSIRH